EPAGGGDRERLPTRLIEDLLGLLVDLPLDHKPVLEDDDFGTGGAQGTADEQGCRDGRPDDRPARPGRAGGGRQWGVLRAAGGQGVRVRVGGTSPLFRGDRTGSSGDRRRVEIRPSRGPDTAILG